MGTVELRAHHKGWVSQWRDLPLEGWAMEIRRNHVEIIPLGLGTPIVLRYGDVDFKKQFMDITKIKAPLLAEPLSDIRTDTSENLHAMIADSLEIATKEETIMSSGFIKLNRSDEILSLINSYPEAFLLLTIIALRARRSDCQISGLKTGEATITCNDGISPRKYRTVLAHLLRTGLISTIKTTNRYTIVKLNDSSIYDLNILTSDKQNDKQPTSSRQADVPTHIGNTKKERMKEAKTSTKSDDFICGCVRVSKTFFDDMILKQGAKNFNDLIQEMADYCASSGKRYKDYEAAVRQWIRRREQQPQKRAGFPGPVPATPKGFASYSNPEAIREMAKHINVVGGE